MVMITFLVMINETYETRNVDSYASFLGIGATIDDFAREARKQARVNYPSEYEARAVNEYIREGFYP